MSFSDIFGWILGAVGILGTVLNIVLIFIKIEESQKVSVTPQKMGVILFFLALLCVGVVAVRNAGIETSPGIADDSEPTVPNSTNLEKLFPFSDNGFVFPQSSSKYITQEDLENLKSLAYETEYTYRDLLNFSINEIYARHGYQFTTEKFDNFYNQYLWYSGIDKKSTITWEMFNTYEQDNLKLLIKEQEDNGFR